MNIPQSLTRTITALHGEAGTLWLSRLPDLIADCASRWNLSIGDPFELSYNYVAPALRSVNGGESGVVLKIGFPSPELSTEIEALALFGGKGSANILEVDSANGAFLIERVLPGTTLDQTGLSEADAARVAAEVMQRLWRPEARLHGFPNVTDWLQAFPRYRHRCGDGGPIPQALLEQAESLATDLLAASPAPMLLHGDLHHGNILTSDRDGYLAIDPKGVIGDPAFEPGAFLLNPHPVSSAALSTRIEVFASALTIDAERIRAWGIVRAVLSACWTVEDNGDNTELALTVATRLLEK